MSGIHNLILNKLQSELTLNLITNIDAADIARAGIVKIGPLQGDPDPDVARISVELYYNDPEQTIKGSGFSKVANEWDDIVDEIEVGGSITWRRRFTVLCRCLLETSREDLLVAHDIASTVRSRIEKSLLKTKWNGVNTVDEYVSRGVFSEHMRSEVAQAGGPPDAYDIHIKIRFEVLTTEMVGA